jgi:cell division protein FtsW (lipid II flippase)
MSTATVTPQAPPKRRNTELALLILAVGISVAAYANVGLVHDGRLPAGMFGYGAGLALIAAVVHLVVRRLAPYADPLMLPAVTLLNGLGLVLIHRIDLARSDNALTAHTKAPSSLAASQLIWAALGVALFVAVLVLIRDHRSLQRYTYTLMALGVVLLALPPLLPGSIAPEIGGAKNWIRIAGFSIQPGEFAKILLAIFFASFFVVKRDALTLASRRFLGLYLPRGRDMGPVLVAWLISTMILVSSKDIGLSMLFFGLFIGMLYISTERLSWVIIGLLLTAAGIFGVYQLFPHVRQRFLIWSDPMKYYNGLKQYGVDSFQLVNALFGQATGGITGTGLGQGHPTLVPLSWSDFIFSTAGEELGLTGLMAIVLVYALIVARGFRTAIAARDSFGKLLAAGLSISLGLQVFVVAGGVTDLIPETGVTMPFLAYGGSSLVANWALIALLLRISDAARRPAAVSAPGPINLDSEASEAVRA